MGIGNTRFDAELVTLGITTDASGVVIGPVTASKLTELIRLCKVAERTLSVNSSENLIITAFPSDVGNA